ncbi:MAG: hypothetical protein GC164_06075 [Phycisphaera sp.]|nr:hypothetical protein [Phycisphaera sp.]
MLCVFLAAACRAESEQVKPASDYRVAVLRDDLPGFNLDRAIRAAQVLKDAGYDADFLTASELADPASFNARRFGLLIIADNTVFPAEAIDNLFQYLNDSGDVALCGGRAFEQLVMRRGDKWKDFNAIRSELAEGSGLVPLSTFEHMNVREWNRSSDNPEAPSEITASQFRKSNAVQLDLKSLRSYDTFQADVHQPIPAGHNVLVLWAKASSPDTKRAAFELQTRSGARWIARVDLSVDWQPTVLKTSDFIYHEGGDKNIKPLRLSDAVKLSFGLARQYGVFKGPDHSLTLAVLGTTELAIASGERLKGLGLYIDYPPFQYHDAPQANTPTSANNWLEKPLLFEGPLTGTAAICVPKAGSSQAYSLVVTKNPQGRDVTAAGVWVHYHGPYAGSQWFIVGCQSDAFYQQPSWDELLVQVVAHLRDETWLRDAQTNNPFADAQRMRNTLGVTHAGALYHFTDEDVLNEGAAALEQLGTRTVKLWIPDPEKLYRFNCNWPKDLNSMTDVLQTAPWKEVLSRPFETYYLEAFAMPRRFNLLDDGLSEEEKSWITGEFENVTRYLLTTYKNTGKTFVLQNWEGDWALRTAMDRNQDPSPQRIQAMIDWLNARQDGVDRARKAVGEQGVRVLHAAEANLVLQQMRDNKPGVIRDVLPHTHVDLATYSCYDTRGNPKAFRAALEYIAMNLPPTTRTDLPNRVVIGEFGVPETKMGTDAVKKLLPEQVEIATAFGCPQILYWALYCNEPRGDNPLPIKRNDQANGYWLIKPDGSHAWAWDYFHNLMNPTPTIPAAHKMPPEGLEPSTR